jgi:hypothetical protein
MTFHCTSCGKEHETLPEPGYQRPDAVWQLNVLERARRVAGGNDFCSLHGEAQAQPVRFFLRGTIPLPVPEIEDSWSVGVWVEVSEADFQRYRVLYDSDASREPQFLGRIANAAKGFEDAFGADVLVQLGTENERPTLWFPAGARCSLSQLQSAGITLARIHSVLGSFE